MGQSTLILKKVTVLIALIRHADSNTLLEDDNASPGTQKTAKYFFGAKKKS